MLRFTATLSVISAILLAGIASGAPPAKITGTDGAVMALIPKGTFVIGSNELDLKATAPAYKVYIDAFYMDIHEVTNEKFARFLYESMPLKEKRYGWVVLRSDLDTEERAGWWPTEIMLEKGRYDAFPGYEKRPVLSVSWFAADEYCRWFGKRLPTEAEWEKAARGGLKKKRFTWGNAIPTGGVIFNRIWADNSEPPPTEPVGSYYPNGFGLFDMAGNTWEWCSDWYGAKYYDVSPNRNPQGPKKGKFKVLRGGSWFNSEMLLRVAFRNSENPYNTDDAMGFRCAMDVPEGKGVKDEAKGATAGDINGTSADDKPMRPDEPSGGTGGDEKNDN